MYTKLTPHQTPEPRMTGSDAGGGAISIPTEVTAPEIMRLRGLAYCAGLFDGDGCIFISRQQLPGRKNLTYRLWLSIVQNDLETLQKFHRNIGGPHFLAVIKRQVTHNRQVYDLRYSGLHALRALRLIHDDLIRKKCESEVAQEFWTEGLMGVLPGPKGLPPDIWKIRERFRRKLSKLK